MLGDFTVVRFDNFTWSIFHDAGAGACIFPEMRIFLFASNINDMDVMVVDDQLENCSPLVKLLKVLGMSAECITSGAEALAALAVALPSVVLLDIMMPGMDGFSVLTKLRSERRYDLLPIIMYTALSDHETRRRAAALGVKQFLVKGDFSFDKLRTMLLPYLNVAAPRND